MRPRTRDIGVGCVGFVGFGSLPSVCIHIYVGFVGSVGFLMRTEKTRRTDKLALETKTWGASQGSTQGLVVGIPLVGMTLGRPQRMLWYVMLCCLDVV